MWTNYIVKPFEGSNTGTHRIKQAALEDAQHRAIANPGETMTVYRAKHYPTKHEIDLINIVTYWFDETINKLQYI